MKRFDVTRIRSLWESRPEIEDKNTLFSFIFPPCLQME